MYTPSILAASLLVMPSLASLVVPGLTDPSQPQCTYVTIYYNSAPELASATSSLLLRSTFCSVTPTSSAAPTPTTSKFLPQVANPGFESTNNPWAKAGGTGNMTIATGSLAILAAPAPLQYAHSGNGYGKVQIPSGSKSILLSQSNFPVSVGTAYTLTAWFNVPSQIDSPDKCAYAIQVDSSPNYIVSYNAGKSADTWFSVSGTYTSTTNTFATISIGISCSGTSDVTTIMVDDFTIAFA